MNAGGEVFAPSSGLRRLIPEAETVVKKGASLACLAAAVTALYLALVFAAGAAFGPSYESESLLNAALIIAIAFLLRPLRTGIQAFVESRLYRGRSMRRAGLRILASDMLRIFGKEEAALVLAGRVSGILEVRAALFLREGGTLTFASAAEADFGLPASIAARPESLDIGPELLRKLEALPCAADLSVLMQEFLRRPGAPGPKDAAGTLSLLLERGFAFAAPLVLKGGISGVLLTGRSGSGDRFTSEDLELLGICAGQAAVALENSSLYSQTLSIKDYYDDIIRSMTTGLLTFDPSGALHTVNRAGAAMLEIEPGRAAGSPAEPVLAAAPELAAMVRGCLSGQGESPSEREFALPGRPGMTVHASVSSILDLKGRTAGAALFITDMTAKKALEKRIEQNRRLAYLGELASGVAHEIKNPLGSIRLFVESLGENFDDPAFRKNFTELVIPEIDSLDSMLKDLLDYSRPSQYINSDTDIGALLRNTLSLLSAEIRKAGVSVRNLTPDAELVAPCDGEKLKRVMINLVQNSLEAMSESGERVLTVSAGQDCGYAEILISDTGAGIPGENITKIFKPFFTTKRHGTGLGLSIAQKIVEESGGSISISSQPGSGTRATVRMPLRRETEAGGEAARPAEDRLSMNA